MFSIGTSKMAGSRLGVVAALLSISMLAGCDDLEDTLESAIHVSLEEARLPNGLRIILAEDRDSPVISYQTWVKVGSVDEKPGKTGLAHLFEHLMFKGTSKHGPRDFFSRLESKGAEVNAYTTRDYTVFYENISPVLLDDVIELESDRLTGLVLTEALLATEREVVFEERRLRTENSPVGRMQEALWQLAYSSHPYQWPTIGYVEDLRSLTVEDLRSFYGQHYQPANTVIVVTGAIRSSEVLPKLKKAYGSIPEKKISPRKIALEPQQTEEKRIKVYDRVASERFAVGYHVSSADQNDSYALDVLCNILFNGQSSRAHRRLVEEKSIALSVGGAAYTPTFPGMLIYSGMMKGGVPSSQAIGAMDELVADLQATTVSAEEISAAVRQLTVDLIESVRTPNGLAQLLGTVTTILGEPERFRQDLAKYGKVMAVQVRGVARKYLKPTNRTVVELMPEEIRK